MLRKISLKRAWSKFSILFLFVLACSSKHEDPRVLVFSKTTEFRHESIPAGIEAIKKLGKEHHFQVEATEDASVFYEENLKRFNAVIFLNTTGDVLNDEQQNNFERYIQAGGGYVGIHAATDTEYDWPWYGKLAGAYFHSHPNNPNVRNAEFYVVDKNHPATDSIPERWARADEFYNFKDINPDIKTLIKIDEKTYEGGTNGDDHPMSWYHEYDGGRAFYTALGHTDETYSETLFLKHLWGGIRYVFGKGKPGGLNYSVVKTKRMPEENRFNKVVLDEKLDEPIELAILPGDRVLFIERKGNVKIYDPTAGKTKVIAKIPVSTKYKSQDGGEAEAEDGLLGVALDPNFKSNNWVYFYYSPAGDEPKNILTRYELKGDELIESSKKVLLEVVVQREQCCHTGGSIAFDANGNLYVSTGDNTNPHATAYAPIDERPGRSPWDAQKSSANTNDLRGKILRIHPEPDGTYTIPDGNLFPKGKEKTRPEIYVMGNRNPYRISVDQKTGYLYWGDVGPDAGKDSLTLGTRAFDEIGQATKAGFFGWPYFVGDNKAYNKYDFGAGKSGAKFDPEKPVNNSPNNTGLTELPPAQKAFIWYPYDKSEEFPLLGNGGRTSMAGPVYYVEDFKNTTRAFPDYFDKKLFIYEWMRGWVFTVTMDDNGDYVSMERFMPNYKFSNPMDMEFSKESGDLYMLEYGTAWFRQNDDARLVRIEYTKGNRKPVVQMAADKTKGAVPLAVSLSANGTKDYDYDNLTYEWNIKGEDGSTIKKFNTPEASFTFDKAGKYTASLSVTDSKGEKSDSNLEILAGNEPPVLSFELSNGNTTFFLPNKTFNYEVKVSDKEDGSLGNGINADQVSVNIDYLKEGFDKIEIAQGHQSADALAAFATGKKYMDESDCNACHMVDKKSIGPMFIEVSNKYKDDPKAIDYLSDKIINGGSGVWGEVAMAAHPQLPKEEVKEMVQYILNLGNKQAIKSLPTKGTFTAEVPKGNNKGVYILRAAYTDQGANGIPPALSEQTLVLRNPNVAASEADSIDGIMKYALPDTDMVFMIGSKNGSFIGFNNIDLTGINTIAFAVGAAANYGQAGGIIEVHTGSPSGPIIGTSNNVVASEMVQGKPRPPQVVLAKIQPINKKENIYFVYKNDSLQAGQSLFTIINIVFQ